FFADAGFSRSAVTTITIDVSAALLASIDFQQRSPRLNNGDSRPVVVIGQFADQADVPLDPAYLAFQSTASNVATISAAGKLKAVAEGTSILIVSSHGQTAATAIAVGVPPDDLGRKLF